MKKVLIMLCILLFSVILTASCSEEAKKDDIDVNLSGLSQTIIQAELQKLYSNSPDYLGKTIKASGTYLTLYYEKTDSHRHYIIVVPGDACCQLGFEFKLKGDNDYPADNTAIEVTGILEKATDIGGAYLYLAVDDIVLSE